MKTKVYIVALASVVAFKSQAQPDLSHLSEHQQLRLKHVEENVERVLSQLSLKEKVSLVHASGKFHVNAIERIGLPELWLSDGPHGVRYQIERDSWAPAGWDDDYSTYLPHLTSVAASWNVDMAKLHGEVLGAEARDRKKDIILGPGVNLARLPLYGRNFEYMGEDPFLAASLVVPVVKGIQSQDVAANAKHYALNTQELNRIGVNAQPDERTLREIYLPAFEAAVKHGGIYSIMGAYNQYYGTNTNQSKHLVKKILKGQWGFDGVLLTDWNVDINTYEAAMNGLDLEMGTNVESYDDYFFAKPLLTQINQGKIPETVLDDKVKRILRLMFRVGLMDEKRLKGARNTKEHQLAARKIASEGIVLLKNEANVLPLEKPKLQNVLILGPNANRVHALGGGSSEVKTPYEITPLQGLKQALGSDVTIQVMRARSSKLMPIAADYIASKHWTGTPAWALVRYTDQSFSKAVEENWIVNAQYQTRSSADEFVKMTSEIKPMSTGKHVLKANVNGAFELRVNGEVALVSETNIITEVIGDIDLNAGEIYTFEIKYSGQGEFTLGWDAPNDLFTDQATYLNAAKNADAVIYFGGLSHADDREAIDRTDMKLPGVQDEVISKLLEVNPNTIVFLVAGSAVEMPWADHANTIVWGWYGGMEAGNAFADMLLGNTNPSGKMPITLPAKLEHTAPIMLNDYNATDAFYKEGVFIGYRWFEQQAIKPIFSFGHGLSYTQFQYSNLKLLSDKIEPSAKQTVFVTVKNIGKRAGAEVVQLYLHDKLSSVERPENELKGFVKVFLQPGQSKEVAIDLTSRDLSFWDVKSNNWLAEAGEFEVRLGSSLDDIRLTKTFELVKND
ncbi:beta-glucosidase family protein [Thalassotalea sp. LPB0316]|uniref:beta-glucosidase family protein n=1 Tax=Thalassotalea sp. LPB0316 TaxID=2769490 RepID=UPI001D050F0E|nr:glycoside hydrolase family 3 C-terminal domain-containing protein [Thalassotalea sp. LPB0316]